VMRILTEMGTQYGQGYLFHRPAPLISQPVPQLVTSVAEH